MSHHHLGYKERVVIKTLLDKKFSPTEIAAELGYHRSTIYRELRRHKSRGGYDSDQADKWSSRRRHVASSRPRRLGAELWSQVVAWLEHFGSVQIAAFQLELSPQTIYNRFHRDSQTPGRRRQWRRQHPHSLLRYGIGWYKRPKGAPVVAMHDARPLRERPPIVASRARRGDWEVDTICFSHRAMALVLCERQTQLVKLSLLPGKQAATTACEVTRLLQGLPAHTITSDRGREFAAWRQVEKARRLRWYVSQPGRPTQRPLVENIIGQLRRLLPRKMPLSELTAANLQKAEHYINHRPRPSKGFNTSHCLFFGKISCRNS